MLVYLDAIESVACTLFLLHRLSYRHRKATVLNGENIQIGKVLQIYPGKLFVFFKNTCINLSLISMLILIAVTNQLQKI